VELDAITVSSTAEITSGVTTQFTTWHLYALGVFVFALGAVFRLMKVFNLFKGAPFQLKDKVKIFQIEGQDSFSFFNRIQLAPALSAADKEIVLEHEKLHVQRKHSYDLVYTAFFQAALWINPIFYFIKKELAQVHEYEVDSEMYMKYKVNYLQFLVNYALRLNHSSHLLTSSFYTKLTLKKRIKHMKTQTKNQKWMLAVLPIIGLSILLLQCTKTESSEQENATQSTVETAVEQDEEIYDVVDVEPSFVGGPLAMNTYMMESISYPEEAKLNQETGIVYVSFVVNSEGDVTNVTIAKGVSNLLDAEAIRVVKEMPKWIPGEVDGENVSVKMVLPFNFKLD